MSIQTGMFYWVRVEGLLYPIHCVGFKNTVPQFKDGTGRLGTDVLSATELEEMGAVFLDHDGFLHRDAVH